MERIHLPLLFLGVQARQVSLSGLQRGIEKESTKRGCVAVGGCHRNRSRRLDEAGKRNDVMHSVSGEAQYVEKLGCICNAGCSGGLHSAGVSLPTCRFYIFSLQVP